MSEYLTTQQAAALVGENTSPRTIVAWIKSGRLQADRYPSARGRFRIKPENLQAAMRYVPETVHPEVADVGA